GPDELRRLQDALGLHVVARSALIVRAPFRRAALAVGRRPPGLGVGGYRESAEQGERGQAGGETSHDVSSREGCTTGAHAPAGVYAWKSASSRVFQRPCRLKRRSR